MAFGFLRNWRDNLIKASFRGSEFFVSKSTVEAGRRAKIYYRNAYASERRKYLKQGYKFANSARQTTAVIQPMTQDFGQDVDEFSIEGYVIANKDNDYDYWTARDSLINALKGFGPGTLKHPFYGEIKVLVKEKARIEEDFSEGGIARFTMTFVQFEDSIFPGRGFDLITSLDESIFDMVSEFLDTFLTTFNAVGAFVTSTIADIGNMINKIVTAVNAISFGLTSLVNGIINGVLNIANSISDLLNSPCELANAFFESADKVQGLVGMVEDVEFGGVLGGCSGEQRGETITLTGEEIPNTLGESVVNALLDQIDFDETDSSLSVTTTEQRENQSLCVDMMKGSLFSNICLIAIRIDFRSVERANALRDKIAEALDSFLLRLGSSSYSYSINLYLKTEKVRNVFVKNMTLKYQDQAREISYKIPSNSITALELAYNEYEDLDRLDEVFKRNQPQVRHPGFLPPGDFINILSD